MMAGQQRVEEPPYLSGGRASRGTANEVDGGQDGRDRGDGATVRYVIGRPRKPNGQGRVEISMIRFREQERSETLRAWRQGGQD